MRMTYPSKRIKYKFGKNKKRDIFVIVLILVVLAVSFIFSQLKEQSALAASSMEDGECELHMIDVGQSDSFLLKTKEGNILIDAGTQSAEYELHEYLVKEGITSFDYVIFTHPHEDHIGNGDMIMESFEVENVIMPDVTSDTVCFESLIESIYGSDAEVHMAEPGATYSVGELSFKIFGPAECDPDDLNNCSIVMRADYGEISILFSGDAEKSAELEVWERYADELDCDIYKVAHHGSSTSNGDEFFGAASPDLALISCGFGNSYGHPHREVIEMLDELGITFKRTDVDGDVVVATDGEKYWLKEE